MSNFITISKFCEKHGVSRNNTLAFYYKGFIPEYVFCTTEKPFLIDEDYCIYMKGIFNRVHIEAQNYFNALVDDLSIASIVRLCIVSGADIKYGYGRELLNSKLFNYKTTSVLAHSLDEKLIEMWRAMAWLVKVVKFIGSTDEKEIKQYMCDILNIPEPITPTKIKKTYTLTCDGCKKTRVLLSRPKGKSGLCSKCAIKEVHKVNTKEVGDLVRYYYFCPTCPSVRAVVSKRKSPFCIDCIKKKNLDVKVKKKKKKVYSQIGKDGDKKNKVKISVKKTTTDFPQSSPERDAQMIAEFLEKRKALN